jgi:hypothetical protein
MARTVGELASHGLVHRYRNANDGLPSGEANFLIDRVDPVTAAVAVRPCRMVLMVSKTCVDELDGESAFA